MGGFAPKRENREKVTFDLPCGLVRQITERADAMHVSVDAVAVVLLKYGLKMQEQREQDLDSLLNDFVEADESNRESALEKIGQSVFGK